MIPSSILISRPVALEEMLATREHRQQVQQGLLAAYGCPLISFTMNIVGEHKVFPLQIRTYEMGVAAIRSHCMAWGLPILHCQEIHEKTGYECFFVVEGEALRIKEVITELEHRSAIGRLFDMDVIRLDGTKVSRSELGLEERRCLLCQHPAFVCARSRTHSVADLWTREVEMMWDHFTLEYAKQVAHIATRALLYEVSATPKAGLVDQNNTGSHSDMDIHTFESSALALLPYFVEFVQCGIGNCHRSPSELFALIRPIGRRGEIAMLSATHNVNTHKGIIFSMGIVTAALGYLYGGQVTYSRANLRQIIIQMVASLACDFDGITAETAVTNGEKLYVAHGLRGIRGEAIEGYPALFQLALPALECYLGEGFSLNDSGILTLLHIMAGTEDSNIIARSDYETMGAVQREIAAYLKGDPKLDYLDYMRELDLRFIARGISPGGSADLLALTYFLHFYEEELDEHYGF